MKKRIAVFVALVALFLFGVFAFYGTGAVEYRTVIVPDSVKSDILNAFGSDGWEVVSQRSFGSDQPTTEVVFQRRVRLFRSNSNVKKWANVLGDQPQALESK